MLLRNGTGARIACVSLRVAARRSPSSCHFIARAFATQPTQAFGELAMRRQPNEPVVSLQAFITEHYDFIKNEFKDLNPKIKRNEIKALIASAWKDLHTDQLSQFWPEKVESLPGLTGTHQPFNIFARDRLEALKAEHPDISYQQRLKLAGKEWRALKVDEKAYKLPVQQAPSRPKALYYNFFSERYAELKRKYPKLGNANWRGMAAQDWKVMTDSEKNAFAAHVVDVAKPKAA